MFSVCRGGRLEFTNQGWSRVKSFLQETEDKFIQQTLRNSVEPKLKSTVQDAHERLTDLPSFFFQQIKSSKIKIFVGLWLINIIFFQNVNAMIPLTPPTSAPQQESPRVQAIKKKIRGVAELYEKQFLREMVKQMRNTVPSNDLFKSGFAETFYREKLDQEYVETWGDKGGIGLGDLIYQQLTERYGPQMGLPPPQRERPSSLMTPSN